MGQKSPINSMWSIARSGIEVAPESGRGEPRVSDDIAKKIARTRSRIDQSGIGDNAVYDENSLPADK